MNVDQCQWPEKMMCTGVDIDLLAQASKHLSERSPYDVPEDGLALGSSVSTLPVALANWLNQKDDKKRRKKSHNGTETNKKNKSCKVGEKLRGGSVWVEHEDYFRRLEAPPDLETLSGLASLRSLSYGNCFSVEYESVCIQQRETDATVCAEETKDILSKEVKKEDVDNEGDEISSTGLEWILGCRNRILLTTERPSKKRRRLGSDAGLEKLVVAAPCRGNALLCDFCCTGGDAQMIVCSSCKATVHKKCYGVVEDTDETWLCSWCEVENGRSESERLCSLCPRKGGALKPVLSKLENGGPAEFAHLFCSLWMPEVYIEDLNKMEPILNLPGIKETRRKLLCNLCKVKSGACVRCCYATCRASFHPICAREAGNRLEIWGKHGCDTVELRAFCSKHSDIQESARPIKGGDFNAANLLPSESIRDRRSNDETGVEVGTQDIVESGMTERSTDNEKPRLESLSFVLILKKLIDLGKVDVKDVAAEIGVNPDALNAKLGDGDLLPDLLGKIVKWLRQHAHMGNRDKCGKFKSTNTTKSERRADICTEGTVMLDSDIVDSLERISAENCTGNGFVVEEAEAKPVLKKEISGNLPSDHSSGEQKSVVLDEECHLGKNSVHLSDDHGGKLNPISSGVTVENAFSVGPNSSQNRGILNCPSPIILDLLDHEAYPGFSPHPYIRKELSEMGKRKTENGSMDSEERTKHLQDADEQGAECGDTFCELAKARKLGILDMSPKDEVEGEFLYYQLKLLGTAVSRKQLSDDLAYAVTKKLPLEIDEEHGRRWDDVLVNKYFHDVREARKQGRKEKRHKEAQAVLAAATAAAATSSRNTSLKKDMTEEPAQQEMSTYRRKVTGSGHLVPQTKETLLKVPVSGPPSEKRSDQRTLENPRSCDICRRSETIWNLIVVCSSCKVAVHMDCYKCAKESTGPWYCELCEESTGSFDFLGKPYSTTECALCGGTTGAFRKATDGQWVHAFCAEWSLESTFRRGQINSAQGMESLAKNTSTCCVCKRIYGAYIKCSYGNCQSTFHPNCARSAGFHMIGGGKLPHKAYCEKHSVEQKAKAKSQKHGAEEHNCLKHYRVELERLRLLCERIVKREKLKRELAISSHEILAARRDHAARSLPVRNPFPPPEVSSDSATTSIRGYPDSNISGSDAIQRSDDITIDSTASVKQQRGKCPDQKTDDSATSKGKQPTESQVFSGKTVPRKHCIISPSVSEEGDEEESKTKKQHVETFAKKLVMTSDEASFKNRRLPKGYFYVPVDCLQEETSRGNEKADSSDKPISQTVPYGECEI